MKRLFYILLAITIQVGILFPSISPAKAAQCCKTRCSHEPKTTPNTCPIKQKGDCRQMNPVDCCKNNCLSRDIFDTLSFEKEAITNIYNQESFSLQLVSDPISSILSDLTIRYEKEGFYLPRNTSSPPIFIQHCSFLI